MDPYSQLREIVIKASTRAERHVDVRSEDLRPYLKRSEIPSYVKAFCRVVNYRIYNQRASEIEKNLLQKLIVELT